MKNTQRFYSAVRKVLGSQRFSLINAQIGRFASDKSPKGSLNDFLKGNQSSSQSNLPPSQPISPIPKSEGRAPISPDKLEEEFPEFSDPNSTYDKNKTSMYIFVLGGITLIGIYLLQKLNQIRNASLNTGKKFSQKNYGKVDIGGKWQLTDGEGNSLSSVDLRKSYYIVYFGFCNCPDICPASLNKLTKAYEAIKSKPESKYFDLKLVFVSVDPERDSPARIRKFLSHFHKDIVGITGKSNDDPELKEMLKKFRIYATKIEFETTNEKGEAEKGYTYDHTVISYLMSDSNEYLTHLGSSLGVKDLADTIVDNIMENENNKIYSQNLQLHKGK
jgi:protein SCO1/2